MKKKYIKPIAEETPFAEDVTLAAVSKTNDPADKGNGQLSKRSDLFNDVWGDDDTP